MDLQAIQAALREAGWDGWFFNDHHHRDPLAYRILGLPANLHTSRRWFYLIPATGEPKKLTHRIESGHLDGLPGEKRVYSGWRELDDALAWLLSGKKRLAAQFSPGCAVPLLSLLDGGTVDKLRGFGVELESSGDLVQYFEARWSEEQISSHFEAGKRVDSARAAAFSLISARLKAKQRISECEVADFIRRTFEDASLFTDHGPIVAVNQHAGDPHYEPTSATDQEIQPGDLVLIDMWAKLKQPKAVYYDITWTGFAGVSPPEKIQQVFQIVRDARDSGIAKAVDSVAAGNPACGFEIDDAARGVISKAGFGDQFVHRTGHSIGEEVHGAGANMDNLETHEVRRIIPGTCFSIEPGIYLPEFGIRSEVNVLIQPAQTGAKAVVTGEIQRDLQILV
jgi:Xaa-Pro dipeptidase